jgi:glycine C-acetyltransferase
VLETVKIPSFGRTKGVEMFGRLEEMGSYVQKFVDGELWLYNRRMLTGPATEVLAQDDNYNILYGVNYASADYLGLAQHPEAKKAAIKAAEEFGLSSGGTPSTLGSNRYCSLYSDSTSSCRRSSRPTGTRIS